MANKKQHLTELAELVKAKKFINAYFKEEGKMPSVDAVAQAKALTPDEMAKVDLQVEIDNLAKLSNAEQVAGQWDYIYNEASWNASYENGALKDYYEYYDAASPYKEDLWNEADQRPANWNDIVKENGVPVEFPDGYHYVDKNGNPCVRCWKGAWNAPGAMYPWAAVKFQPLYATIKFSYEGEEDVFPWGESMRQFKRTFAIASIPSEFGKAEWKSDFDGKTSFDVSKFNVTLFKEQ